MRVAPAGFHKRELPLRASSECVAAERDGPKKNKTFRAGRGTSDSTTETASRGERESQVGKTFGICKTDQTRSSHTWAVVFDDDGPRERGNDAGAEENERASDTLPNHARHRATSPAHIDPSDNPGAASPPPSFSSDGHLATPGSAPRGTSATPPSTDRNTAPDNIELPMNASASAPRLDLASLALHSPSHIVGTPAPRDDVPFEYPFPRAYSQGLVSPASSATSSVGGISPLGLPLASPRPIHAGSYALNAGGILGNSNTVLGGTVVRSPPPATSPPAAHPKLQRASPPIPPSLLQKARARSSSCRLDSLPMPASNGSDKRRVSSGSVEGQAAS